VLLSCLFLKAIRTFSLTASCCLSVESRGQTHVKSDIQAQISFFKELILDDFEAGYAL
jgi:hypothetical protein